jgi:predicted DNA-binding protein YlxM (UPF0122 family)
MNSLSHTINSSSPSFENISNLRKLPFDKFPTPLKHALRDDRLITKSAIEVFRVIYEYSVSLSGRVWIGQQRIADETGCCKRTVYNSIKRLVKGGYLYVKKNTITQTYDYTIKICSQIEQKIQTLKDCLFSRCGKNCELSNHSYNSISTSNIDNKENLNNTEESDSQDVLADSPTEIISDYSDGAEQEIDKTLEKLPASMRERMLSIKRSLGNKKKRPKIEQKSPKNRLSQESHAKVPANKEVQAQAIEDGILNNHKVRETRKHKPQHWEPNFREKWKIQSMAMQGIKLNPCDEYPNNELSEHDRAKELEFRIESKVKLELATGRAKNFYESIRMSQALIDKNKLERYHGAVDDKAIEAEKEYAEHEKRKKEECGGFNSLMDSVGVTFPAIYNK